MDLQIGEQGLLIPIGLLEGVRAVQPLMEDGAIVLLHFATTGSTRPSPDHDGANGVEPGRSIFDLLGSEPIDGGPADASERHDHCINGDPHGLRGL